MIKNSLGLKKVQIGDSNPGDRGFKTLVKDVLHGQEIIAEPGLSIFALPDGTIIEIYSIGAHVPDYLFSHNKIVTSYQVPDLHAAVEELKKKGANLLGTVVQLAASCYYCHLCFEDGCVFGLFQYADGIL
jgi:hypothetical protein